MSDPAERLDRRASEAPNLRFAVFELDLANEELRRAGVRIRLAPKPFRLLALLAQSGGRLVRREVIRRHLWAGERFGDFDGGINALVREVRRALGDRASSPRFIATERHRGYRFVVPVEALPASAGDLSGATHREPGPRSGSPFRWDRALALIVPLAVTGALWATVGRTVRPAAAPAPPPPPG